MGPFYAAVSSSHCYLSPFLISSEQRWQALTLREFERSGRIAHVSALAGLWRFDEKPDTADDCARMLAVQRVYGPQESAIGRQGRWRWDDNFPDVSGRRT